MIALDTNVLVRYITQDDPEQGQAASRRIEAAADAGETLFLSPIVLCELVWVLHRSYRLPRAEIAAVVRAILRTAQFDVPSRDSAIVALDRYESGRADFADYLIAQSARDAGSTALLTFDRGLMGEPFFEHP